MSIHWQQIGTAMTGHDADTWLPVGYIRWDDTYIYYWDLVCDHQGYCLTRFYTAADVQKILKKSYQSFKRMGRSEPLQARYYRTVVEDDYECLVTWWDRLTGQSVRSYDAGDPANANPNYGGQSDSDWFTLRKRDIMERIPATLGR